MDNEMSIKFKFLPAGKGDAILISVNGKNMLIDGGEPSGNLNLKKDSVLYGYLFKEIDKIKESKQRLNLVILTHCDDDHIKGIKALFENNYSNLIDEVWYNTFSKDEFSIVNKKNDKGEQETSTREQVKFEHYLGCLLENNKKFIVKSKISIENYPKPFKVLSKLNVSILSPTQKKLDGLYKKYEKEKLSYETSGVEYKNLEFEELLKFSLTKKDSSITNGSSIAFILTYRKNLNFLFLGDSHVDVIVSSLKASGYTKTNKLTCEFVKLSHHGSSKNINKSLLELLDCRKFIISTNGAIHKHPDLETIASIVKNIERNTEDKIVFYFNYKSVIDSLNKIKAFSKQNKKNYNFEFNFLEGDLLYE
jgi:beta-lactamase superfamily II metal-dependent hydrolase